MANDRGAAISSMSYLVRWLLAIPEEKRERVVGADAKPWCEMLDHVTLRMRRDLRPVVVPLLTAVTRKPDALTSEQHTLVGSAARRVFAFAWSESKRDAVMIRCAIEAVCRTFGADPRESVALLQRLIEPRHLAEYGFEELPTLVGELKFALRIAPDFVEKVYRAALSFTETDDAPTSLGGRSQILPLYSNRRQDYRLGQHQLGELFPQFVSAAPVEAAGTVIAAVEVEMTQHARLDAISEVPIRFIGMDARFAEDLSCIWDSSQHRHDLPEKLLDGFEEGLVCLGAGAGESAQLLPVLTRIGAENRFAAVWRRVLSAAIREPSGLGCKVWELAASVPVLTASDTAELIGRYLQTVFQLLNEAHREAIERAILSIPAKNADGENLFVDSRDRLLGCIAAPYVVTPEAKARLRELENAGGPPENTPLFEMGDVTCEEFTEMHLLESQGVELEVEPNRHLRLVSEPVAQFVERYRNQYPTQDEAISNLPLLIELHEALTRGPDGADARMVLTGANALTGACATIAGAEWIEGDRDTANFVRTILLDAAGHESPSVGARREQHFEENGGVVPSPRWYAANGLLNLVRFPALAGAEVTNAIGRLSEDSNAEVRSAVAAHITVLYRNAPELFWRLVRRVEAAENSRRVIFYILNKVAYLARQCPRELLDIVRVVFHRFCDDSQAGQIRCVCLTIAITANAFENEPYDGEMIRTVVSNMTFYTTEALHLVRVSAERLTLGPIEQLDHSKDRLRLTSFTFLRGIANAVQEWLRSIETRLHGCAEDDWPEDARPQIDAVHRVAHELGQQTYFASGAFDQKMGAASHRRADVNDAMKKRFILEGMPLLNLLGELGIPDVVHNCIQLLTSYASTDPKVVFLAVARTVRHGSARGYQNDPLAVRLVVALVRRYIADYRTLFREDTECRDALIELLDTFVGAGWPEALDLTSRLEEVFR